MASIDAQKMRLYRQSAQKRAEQKEDELQCRHQWALSIAKEAAAILKNEFQVQRVVLFGSMVDWQATHANSDLDLAVWGLSDDALYSAVGRLLALDNRLKIDLVMAEDVSPNVMAEIERLHQEL
ncbi:nucleotidyltransferase family protein [Leptothoe spongobia]|uniref:Nucleotidyltransferase domain-containing protein n=1 Tax=Leptothoe spongobia TAU-MAC 1115 TaxID=1967444 RepID=A0A947DIU2_9CYAN|nr:nucleotidyltransferase domain-containing protein [Leptothoe spongobia]MBT9317493.1 nucleotidyltransferase domain-containing protein [Leptothoe spongobia TAU-MAC 1115]